MKKIFAYGILMASASLFFAACGDDVIDVNQFDGILTSDSLESLECNDKNDGQLAYIADSAKVFACFDGEWQSMTGAKAGNSCSVEPLKKKDGYKVVCDGDSVGVLLSGEDAEEPTCSAKSTKKGIEVTCGGKAIGVLENGESGKSCSVKDTTESKGKKRSGLAVLCGGKVSGVIWNGENGEQGESCYIDSVTSVNGVIKMVCGEDTTTLYKALCGGKPYDPEKQFCYIDSIVDLCGGEIYDIEEFFCVDDTTYEICSRWEDGDYTRIDYDPKTEICVYNGWDEAHKAKRFATCQEIDSDFGDIFMPSSTHILPEFSSNDDTFDRLKYFCGTNDDTYIYEITEKCDGQIFDITYAFCYKDIIYYNCGGEDYNPDTQFCSDEDEVKDLCGGKRYVSEVEFCHNDVIYSGCGDDGMEEYNPDTHFCSDEGQVEERCNGMTFSPMNNELCDEGVIKTVCFQEHDYAKEIDPTKQFCGNMNVLDIKEYCDDGLPVDNTYFSCDDDDGDGLTERRGGDY